MNATLMYGDEHFTAIMASTIRHMGATDPGPTIERGALETIIERAQSPLTEGAVVVKVENGNTILP